MLPMEKAPAMREVAIDRLVWPATLEETQLKTRTRTATIELTKYIPARSPILFVAGKNDIKAPPRAPGIARPAIQSHLFELLPTAMLESTVTKILTIPEGMLRRADLGPVYPKPLIRVAE